MSAVTIVASLALALAVYLEIRWTPRLTMRYIALAFIAMTLGLGYWRWRLGRRKSK